MDLRPQAITAFLVDLKSKVATFILRREVNDYPGEPLMTILPSVTLQELWGLMDTAEKALFVVSLFIVLTGLIDTLTAILTGLSECRRKVAILCLVGACPWHIFGLLPAEVFSLTPAGVVFGLCLLYLSTAASQGYAQASYGIHLPLAWPNGYEQSLLGATLAAAMLISYVPT